MLGDIEEFVTGHPAGYSTELERILATVLFIDIVDSTRNTGAMGDQSWRWMLDSHDQASRDSGEEHRRRNFGDLRWARPRGPMCTGFGSASQQIGLRCRCGQVSTPARSN
ncbi:hypothetical protein HU675_0049545 (plasmid) [Bradyrhizobium septentrionale]|uniref:hypothetical protein n=1 Tax=Bradyrhizobium septentrionale TaxID=1404411 RepID=UPI001CCE7677|nr:hypothetical protein [Bradyrhizobium septentrionale]UGY30324.1 hypothetical protein HU675_0049545 [Bradyrhizobium septentrionale]